MAATKYFQVLGHLSDYYETTGFFHVVFLPAADQLVIASGQPVLDSKARMFGLPEE